MNVLQCTIINDDEWKAIHGTTMAVRMIKNSLIIDDATDDDIHEIVKWLGDNLTGLGYIVIGPPTIVYFEVKDDAVRFKLSFPRE